jgi:FlaA1/EpsC-like NDP-sugar epimerase
MVWEASEGELPDYYSGRSPNRDLRGKEILITGGTGSLGKTLTKALIKDGHAPRGIRIFSRDEAKHSQMEREMQAYQEERGTTIPIAYLIGDVRDRERVRQAMRNVDVVIHAAAMKQVPACEKDPDEAIQTNVIGTANVVKAILDNDVERAMYVSTDKAVYPINLYGATKMTAEKLFIHSNIYSGRKDIKFSCCRYGNVFGSRGSVIPIFQQQLKEGRPFTITHPHMTRFWITLPTVARFLLTRLNDMDGGEIFVPIMPSCTMETLVKYLDPRHPVAYTGMRFAEKKHETLITKEEKIVDSTTDFYTIVPQGTEIHEYQSDKTSYQLSVDDFQSMFKETEV